MRRPHRRAILVVGLGQPDPELPAGLAIIDRRVCSRSASRPGEVAHSVQELLVAGDALTPVPEMCEPWRVTIEELRLAAATHAAIVANA